MDDVGTLVAKLALRSKLISPAQFETVSQAYAQSGGRKPYGAILLESGILNGGALTRLLHEHQRRISSLVEEEVEPLARRHLPGGVLLLDALLAAEFEGFLAEFFEVVQLVRGRHGRSV